MPYGPPPGPDEAYHSAPTQMYGGAPQQPDYAAPANPYGQPQQQPFDAANPYGAPQQGYGAPPPQYGAQPQFGGYQPPGPPPKKGNGLVIGLVVGAVVVVGGIGAAIALHKSNNPTPIAASTTTAGSATTAAPEPTTAEPTATDTGSGDDGAVSLPQSTSGLVLMNSPVAQQAVTRVQGGLSSSGSDAAAVYQNALVGAYGPTSNGDPTTILVVQPFTNLDSTDQSEFEDSSAATIVSGIMTGADATNVKTVQSSDANAAISCGNVTSSGVSFYMCSWVDEDTFGVTYFYNKPDPATAGQQTDELRNGADGD